MRHHPWSFRLLLVLCATTAGAGACSGTNLAALDVPGVDLAAIDPGDGGTDVGALGDAPDAGDSLVPSPDAGTMDVTVSDAGGQGDGTTPTDAITAVDSTVTDLGAVTDVALPDAVALDIAVMDSRTADSGATDTGGTDTGGTDTGGTDTGCGASEALCGAVCVRVVNNPEHCGDCSTVCGGARPFCVGRTCMAACPAGLTLCGGRCVDTQSDVTHCGSCGAGVCHLEVCVAGARRCGPGYTACGAAGCLGCHNLDEDPEACGGCGTRCDTDQVCSRGACMDACPGGSTRCGRKCVRDLQTDMTNCGACGVVCGPGTFCVRGTCAVYTAARGCSTCPCPDCTGTASGCCAFPAGRQVCTSPAGCP